MTTYLISIFPNNQWGADWKKRRFYNDGKYQLYHGLDQLNAFLNTELDLNSNEFLEIVKFKIKELIEHSIYKSAYEEKLSLLDDRQFNFVIVDDVGDHGNPVYKKDIELINCNEFAHIDEVVDIHNIDGLEQMNRLYICPKGLSQTTFINHNFPNKTRDIKIPIWTQKFINSRKEII